ncbi:MAG: protein translocase subunit SecD [Chloroflexi bacterium]|nr:protein translocase subunit SecD [Chloroflexota bacterium]
MRRANTRILLAILVLAILGIAVIWPKYPSSYLPGFIPWPESPGVKIGSFERRDMKLGLDLQGGTNVVLEADLSDVPSDEHKAAMDGVREIIERRINAFGVAESVIQQLGDKRLAVQLPGVKDPDEAVKLIGQTAQLDFRECILDKSCQKVGAGDGARWVVISDDPANWQKAKGTAKDGTEQELTGRYLRRSNQVVTNQTTGQPEVSFQFNNEGARLFEQITGRLAPRTGEPGKPLGIFLDDQMISAPIVQAIIGSEGVINNIALKDAQTLAIQLNAGALPVPVKVIQQQDVDATLGKDSIHKSIVAGEIGLLVIILFMLLYYRLPGVLASLALILYAIVTLAVFKLFPVTLTLAGIAAFILSLGMAVDANILTFERMKEELRAGRSLAMAMEAGFARAWPSIRDSNVSTMITCLILYWFGGSFGASFVQGFALTLFIGVAISMFSALVVTRALLRALLRFPVAAHERLYRW